MAFSKLESKGHWQEKCKYFMGKSSRVPSQAATAATLITIITICCTD